jgi:hypothetical protein
MSRRTHSSGLTPGEPFPACGLDLKVEALDLPRDLVFVTPQQCPHLRAVQLHIDHL